MNALIQIGAFYTVTSYNKEFTKWLLQVPTMAVEEQICQELKNRIRVGMERSEAATLPEAMRIADRMYSSSNNRRGAFIFSNGPDSGPIPMEIGQIP